MYRIYLAGTEGVGMASSGTLSRDLRAEVRAGLGTLKQTTGAPLVFSGMVDSQHAGSPRRLVLKDFVGSHSGGLKNLEVAPCSGLGGRAAGSGRPQVVPDYRSSRMISHEYDAQVVQAEGLKSVCALPLMADRAVFGVIYVATRDGLLGDRVLRQADGLVRRLGHQMHALSSDHRTEGGLQVRSAAEAVQVLDDVIDGLPDPATRARLVAVRKHLAAEVTAVPEGGFGLTRRELDVLRLVAQGATNMGIGEELRLSEKTVKAYLNAAMRKLEVRNRTSAVRVARSAGVL